MRILGIDPGLAHCGYALLHGRAGVAVLGCMVTKPGPLLVERMRVYAAAVDALIEQYDPDTVVVESPSFPRSARSALMLGAAYGVILGVLAGARQRVLVTRRANEWRALVGLGTVKGSRARKASTREAMISRWSGLNGDFYVRSWLETNPKGQHEHALDALAIATSELPSC